MDYFEPDKYKPFFLVMISFFIQDFNQILGAIGLMVSIGYTAFKFHKEVKEHKKKNKENE